MQELTTTSYAILGLLALRPWTTYELATQMQRSVRNFWPRAERGIYDEPKKLLRHGLARARTEYTGRRRRTVYSITPKGRRALRAWIEEPGAPPTVEFEALTKVFFSDQGTKEGLLANIRAVREWAEAETRRGEAFLEEYLETGGPFPERLHIIAVMVRWLGHEYGMAVLRWARWAEEEVSGWPDTVSPPVNMTAFEELLRETRDALADPGAGPPPSMAT